MSYLALAPIGFLTPGAQIGIILFLFLLQAYVLYREVQKTGKMFGVYPVSVSIFFAPLYEEIIFRGFVLPGFLNVYSTAIAIALTSLLFGVWHLKNVFWEGKIGVAKQMAYAGLVVGPICAFVTLWTGTIWMAVILHFLNNLWSPVSKQLFSRWARRQPSEA